MCMVDGFDMFLFSVSNDIKQRYVNIILCWIHVIHIIKHSNLGVILMIHGGSFWYSSIGYYYCCILSLNFFLVWFCLPVLVVQISTHRIGQTINETFIFCIMCVNGLVRMTPCIIKVHTLNAGMSLKNKY